MTKWGISSEVCPCIKVLHAPDGSDWTVTRLKEASEAWHVPGITEDAMGRKIQGTLLSLLKQRFVVNVGDGVWRKTEKKAAA